ncbi:hypothetical protein [Methylobacterium sp. P1-11]|uniref:hypothetical protein n=1 Tax=Methylobacterium sp. P1-11 TaxID=2024616 RepID=UPI0011ED169C|nr:hypothetical protein [Methylobacterium sp. P1-11]
MPSLKLSNLFRRNSGRHALKDRAAGLRASLSAPDRSAVPLLAPGSDEAKAAWLAACHEHTIRTQFANEYPELKRTPLEWWTFDSISKALETGELSPAECARLYPLATERELRMAEIEHELNTAGLFALAYADEYPVKTAPDPVLSAIDASRRAEAAMTAFAASVEGRRLSDAEQAREAAIEREQRATRAAVWAAVPTTAEGRAALARYVVLQAELTFGADWRAKVQEEFCGDYLLALLAAVDPNNQAQV